LRTFIPNRFTKLSRIVMADWGVEIREWIETWSQLITDNDPALVLLVDRQQTGKTRVAVDYLQGVANKLGIDFFAEDGIVPEFDLGLPRVGNRQP
jgi:hypothetical protein